MAHGSNVVPGDPKNWPRTAARSSANLTDAIDELIAGMDDANMKFAIPEFIRERVAMVLSTLGIP